MNIHEYQAKDLFEMFGVAVPKGVAGTSAADYGRAPGHIHNPGGILP